MPQLRLWLHARECLLRQLLLLRPCCGPTEISVDLMRTPDGGALSYLGLFTSVGTLLCCALPSLLVLVGLGATVASALASAPWLVILSRHKAWVFATSAILIAGNFYYVYRLAPRMLAQRNACPIDDPSCSAATRTSRLVLWISTALLLAGFAVAYLLPVLLESLYA